MPPPSTPSLFLRAARNHVVLIAATTLVALAIGALLVSGAQRTYEAQAQLLVSPVGDASPVSGLGLLRESSDPTRDVETAARLVTTATVAERVRGELQLQRSADSLRRDVRAEPVAQSDLVAVTARAGDPALAQSLANGFAAAAIATRGAQFERRLAARIARLQSSSPRTRRRAASTDASNLATLESLQGGGDPTLLLETTAQRPADPVAPRSALTMLAALVLGLAIGLGGAIALERLAPRLRRETELRERGLPVLARVGRQRPDAGDEVAVRIDVRRPVAAPFRALQATLAAAGPGRRTTFVCSPGENEGAGRTAVDLALAFAQDDRRVLLVDGDLGRPSVARALRLAPPAGLVEVLLGQVGMRDAIVEVPGTDGRLLVLAASGRSPADPAGADYLMLPSAPRIPGQAKRFAGTVIIAGPPLADGTQALPLAGAADEALVVVEMGRSRLDALDEIRRLLGRHGTDLVGVVAIEAADRLRIATRAVAGLLRRPRLRMPAPSSGLTADRGRDTAG